MPEITYKELLRSLPQVLQEDRSLSALAEAVAAVLAEEAGKADRARIYPALEIQPEEVLDILAYDFKVDWWDPDYTAEEKLQTLRDSFDVHRRLGTKRAVETAISGIYEETEVTEWFEYGGEPYHFKIMIDAAYQDADPEKHAKVLEGVNYYKNLRSVLDGVEYYDGGGTAEACACAADICADIRDTATAIRY